MAYNKNVDWTAKEMRDFLGKVANSLSINDPEIKEETIRKRAKSRVDWIFSTYPDNDYKNAKLKDEL